MANNVTMSMFAYAAAKSVGEKALWNYVEGYPDVDITASKPLHPGRTLVTL